VALIIVGTSIAVEGLLIAQALQDPPVAPGLALGRVVPRLTATSPAVRDLQPYAGFGAWVDGFDFGVAYQKGVAPPPVSARVIDDLASHGVKTLFLQAVRADTRSPDGFVDPETVADMLIRAHKVGMKVVGWYLPRFRSVDEDLANLNRLADLDVIGHRFDGIAVDIEYTDDVPDLGERNARLIELSRRFRTARPGESIGAIVLPPVQIEVINERLWPDFPYAEIKGSYDVWLPMSYWTFRTEEYGDGYTYNEESTRRLRADLGDPRAVVHAIGGIGDVVTREQLDAFARSLVDTSAVGGSIYDWNSMTPATRAAVAELFQHGAAASLVAPPR
jgi:hypothetical protein